VASSATQGHEDYQLRTALDYLKALDILKASAGSKKE
jgi:hypothetical protein